MLMKLFPAVLCASAAVISLWGITVRAHADETSGEQFSGPRCSMEVEYLPNFVYDDEKVTAAVRISLAGDGPFKGLLAVESSFIDRASGDTVQREVSLENKPQQRFHFNLDQIVFGRKIRYIRFSIKTEEHVSGPASYDLRLVRPEENLPEYTLENGMHFKKRSGERLIFVIRHMQYVQKRKWLFVKWIGNRFKRPAAYKTWLLLAAPLCTEKNDRRNYISVLKDHVHGITHVELSDFSDQGSYPILENAVRFRPALDSPVRERAVLFLPYSDFLSGTGKREYRMCCEFIIQRLYKAGYNYNNMKIVAPAVPKPLEKQFEPYIQQLAQIAMIYYIPFSVPSDLGDMSLWAVGNRKQQAVSRYPTFKGHRYIAEYLENEIK